MKQLFTTCMWSQSAISYDTYLHTYTHTSYTFDGNSCANVIGWSITILLFLAISL